MHPLHVAKPLLSPWICCSAFSVHIELCFIVSKTETLGEDLVFKASGGAEVQARIVI